MTFLWQSLDVAKKGFQSANCYQFARANMKVSDRPNKIAPPYSVGHLSDAILAAGGVKINTADLYNQYNASSTQYVLIAAMCTSQEFHFMRKGSNGKWLGKWSKVGDFYQVDYDGPRVVNDSLATVNAQLLKMPPSKTGSFISVGYFAFPVANPT